MKQHPKREKEIESAASEMAGFGSKPAMIDIPPLHRSTEALNSTTTNTTQGRSL